MVFPLLTLLVIRRICWPGIMWRCRVHGCCSGERLGLGPNIWKRRARSNIPRSTFFLATTASSSAHYGYGSRRPGHPQLAPEPNRN